MIQINLLPWREQARQIKKAQFTAAIVACLGITFFIILLFHIHLSNIARAQRNLSNILQDSISQEQNILNDMRSKEEEKIGVDTQLNFIINLYKESYSAVRLLNEMAKIVPSSITIVKISRRGDQIILAGIANGDDDISAFMQDISKSPYFNQPVLSTINQDKSHKSGNSRFFQLNVTQKE